MRKIIHIDMDCFYAAIEMRDNPDLADQPIAVGGTSNRGVICTSNYKAREYGVHSAMPKFQALHKCPKLVFVPVRFDAYRKESQHIQNILFQYTDLVEPLSLDEAYLDVSHREEPGSYIAQQIRRQIFKETRLTASAGIAPNKMLAKISSDWKKPNGQFEIRPDQLEQFVKPLPIKKIWGMGPKSCQKLKYQGVYTCADLQAFSLQQLSQMFGKWGVELYQLCRGLDSRAVTPSRKRKSLSNERTYSEDLSTLEACMQQLPSLLTELKADLSKMKTERKIAKAFIKIKFSDFQKTTAECKTFDPTIEVFQDLLTTAYSRRKSLVRLIGLGVRFEKEVETHQLEFNTFN